MKRNSLIIGVLVFALIFSSGMGLAAGKSYTLRFTTVAAPTQPIVKGMEKFAEVVDKLSGGKIMVKIFNSGQFDHRKIG